MSVGARKSRRGLTGEERQSRTPAAAVVQFMDDIGKGFSPSAFGDRFQKEVHEGCAKPAKGKPARIQELARFLVGRADHHGVAKLLQRVARAQRDRSGIRRHRDRLPAEFWDAVQLGAFETADAGLAEITHRRTIRRPKPPAKAISIIHKAKGLECDASSSCRATQAFPDKPDARCLLYVALSRARKWLSPVVSTSNPTPLLKT